MDQNRIAVDTYNKIAKRYTNRYFDDITDIAYIEKFLNLLPKNARILDVGCGPGMWVKYLLAKGFQAEGIDLSEKMINIAKEKVPAGKFKVMDMRRMAYDDSVFDGLLISYSLIHIPTNEIVATLKEFERVLKPMGVILIIGQKGEKDKIVDEPLKKGERTFINFFSKQSVENSLEKAGFGIIFLYESELKDSQALSKYVYYVIAKNEKL